MNCLGFSVYRAEASHKYEPLQNSFIYYDVLAFILKCFLEFEILQISVYNFDIIKYKITNHHITLVVALLLRSLYRLLIVQVMCTR